MGGMILSVGGLRREEEWARSLISRALGVPVVQHDDGSLPGMYDLVIRNADGSVSAVEVTMPADGPCIALWNHMNGKGRWAGKASKGHGW